MSIKSNVILFAILMANFAFYVFFSDFIISDYFKKFEKWLYASNIVDPAGIVCTYFSCKTVSKNHFFLNPKINLEIMSLVFISK